jgi:hypothetical protein
MTAENRVMALQLAVSTRPAHKGQPAAWAVGVTAIAGVFYEWLEGPAVMVLACDSITYQQDAPDGPGTPTIRKGRTVQLTDLQQVTLTVGEQDSKGQPVSDQLDWSVDNSSVVTITPSADTQSCVVAGQTDGTATVTVTDNSVSPPLSGSDVITVVSSQATAIVINEGTPEQQSPASG